MHLRRILILDPVLSERTGDFGTCIRQEVVQKNRRELLQDRPYFAMYVANIHELFIGRRMLTDLTVPAKN